MPAAEISALLAIAYCRDHRGVVLVVPVRRSGSWEKLHIAQITPASALAFVYLTLFGSLVGFTAYVWLLQVSTPRASPPMLTSTLLIAVISAA